MINIFAKPAFVNTSPGQPYTGAPVRNGHLQRVSSMIRGDQIAERLGANLNPPTVMADDVNIYVKPHVKDGKGFEFQGRAWLDIIDGWRLCGLARANPDVGVIACSETDGASLREVLPNRVVVIPQHHANFERAPRTREGVTVVGVIGTESAFEYLPAGLDWALAERGIKLECFSKFFARQDIVDFYQRIDVQLVWRPYRMRLANPLKLVNAAAFGVPTIALEEPYFAELWGEYLTAKDLGEILAALDKLRGDPSWYDYFRDILVDTAERYHIDRVAEKYKELVCELA